MLIWAMQRIHSHHPSICHPLKLYFSMILTNTYINYLIYNASMFTSNSGYKQIRFIKFMILFKTMFYKIIKSQHKRWSQQDSLSNMYWVHAKNLWIDDTSLTLINLFHTMHTILTLQTLPTIDFYLTRNLVICWNIIRRDYTLL